MSGVVVTGVGAVTPVGNRVPAFVEAVRRRERGTACDADDLRARLNPNQARRLDRLSQILLVAAIEAAADARLDGAGDDRIGVVVGTGLGCLETTARYLDGIARVGLGFADPLGFPDSMDSSPAAHVAIALGARGPSMTVTQREISGECALVLAALLIERAAADAVVVAAGDSAGAITVPLLRRLVRGVVPGEAGAAVVLESADSAAARGAVVRARLIGQAQSAGLVRHPAIQVGDDTLLARISAAAIAMARRALAVEIEVTVQDPEEVGSAVGWCLADGVLRAVLAVDRVSRPGCEAVLVGRAARGGAAAALVVGRP